MILRVTTSPPEKQQLLCARQGALRGAGGGGACGESPGRAPGAICIELVLLSVTAGRHLPQPAGYARASPQSSASPALGSRRQPPARGLLKEPAALPGRAPAPEERHGRLGASGPRAQPCRPWGGSRASPGFAPRPGLRGGPARAEAARSRERLPSALQRVDTGGFTVSTSKQITFIVFIQALFQDKEKNLIFINKMCLHF